MEEQVIQGFELSRFLGKWYEIARFEHIFERGMQAVTAEYSIRSDGKVRVINRGHRGAMDGSLAQVVGKAKLGNPKSPNRPGYLKVSFFGPFYTPYYILALDADYRYALVGGKKRKYLWILSREPQLPQDITQGLITKAKELGFDVSRLVFVQQHPNGAGSEPCYPAACSIPASDYGLYKSKFRKLNISRINSRI